MNPYPLPELLQEINKWIAVTGFPRGIQISWTSSQLEAVVNYFSKYEVESAFGVQLCLHQEWPNRFQPKYYERFAKIIGDFCQEIRELFRVPKLHQISNLDMPLRSNQLVAGFISFLLQLLNLDPHYDSFRFRFMEDLRFLVTILWDAPFQANEHEQVQNLLVQFDQVANEAGALVHSLIFSPDSLIGNMDEAVNSLSQNIQLLNGYIGSFLNLLPNIEIGLKSSCSIDSLFIVNSLLNDLEDLIERDDGSVDIKHLGDFRQELKFFHFLFDKRIFQELEIQELKVHGMQIKDVAYEAEYLINSYMVGDLPLWYLNGRLTHLIHKIQLIRTKIQEAMKDYEFGDSEAKPVFSGKLPLQPKNYGEVADVMVGSPDTERRVLFQLVDRTSSLQVISIFGLAGLGKTTLAKKLYNHPTVRCHFGRMSWCVVSQSYKRKNLLSSILMDVRSDLGKATILNVDEESLAVQIYKSLKGRRYMIVLDDIWNRNVWDDLTRFFPNDGNGSRILFTSRFRDVTPVGSIIHPLPSLSNVESWKLLEHKVFGNKPCPEELLEIGQQIAADCHGLPLQVVVIAGLLSTKIANVSTWESFRGSVQSYILDDARSNSTLRMLEFSYRHLPQQLKPCFLYIGVFPEDDNILVKKLIHLWIAEGFICTNVNESAESVAEQQLADLIHRSLVTVDKRRVDGGAKTILVHDLLRGMCLKIAEEENFLKVADHDSLLWNQKYHRICVRINPSYQPSSGYLAPYGPFTRTLFGTLPDISLILSNMKLLRVLCCQTKLNGLFGIELLENLRYVVLDHMFPSIACLGNLEFLIVNSDSIILTSHILNMAKLKYLRLQKSFFAEDCTVSQTNNLEFLSCVALRNPEDVKMLKNSPLLRRLKCEYDPSWEEGWGHPCLDFHFLSQLESLTIKAGSLHPPIADIKLPKSIRKLSLSGFGLPWEKMSIIGALPCLEVLKLGFHAFEGETWVVKMDDEFKELKFLKLNRLNISSWEVDNGNQFPKLQQLVIQDCSDLREIPKGIGDIATLQSIEIRGTCRDSLVRSATQIQEAQENLGKGVFTVHMHDIESGLPERWMLAQMNKNKWIKANIDALPKVRYLVNNS